MELWFKILYLLCLSSATISLQFLPSLNLKGPIGLDLSIGGINSNIQNKKLLVPLKKCLCFPSNANSRPVTSYFEAPNGQIQRLVVFVYKINGAIKMYVPNKQKQELIPELNFDDNDGDILEPVSSESIVDIFDSDAIKLQETVVSVSQNNVIETEPSDIGNNNEEQPIEISGNEELVSGNTEYLPVDPSDSNNLSVEENSIDGENVAINDVSRPSNENQGTDSIILDQSSQSTSSSHSKPQEISNQVTVIDAQDLNITPNMVESDQQKQQISSISNIQILGDQDKNMKRDKINNLGDFNQMLQILSPQSSQAISEILLQQSPNLTFNPYISFNEWFEIQLKRVLLYNLKSQSKIIELRKRIQKILQDNGMSISLKGIVTDSNKKLVQMNNIKLRPILIGSQIDPQTLLDQQNVPDTGVLYVQLIEVILVSPPKLLGTLIMGTVYLPRNIIKTPNVNLLDNNEKENIESKHGCITCRLNNPQNSHSRHSYSTAFKYYPSYNPYYTLPFRPTVLKYGLPYEERNAANVQGQKQGDEISKTRSGILDTILGTLTPILFSPSRRLLGGRVPQGSKLGPRPYPNDVQPGFRIIGGNAATSSGTPLANKGRSAFEKPSYII